MNPTSLNLPGDIILIAALLVIAAVPVLLLRALYRHARRALLEREPQEQVELDKLIKQERLTQALPVIEAIAPYMPLDCVRVHVVLHYTDAASLTLDCEVHRQRVEL